MNPIEERQFLTFLMTALLLSFAEIFGSEGNLLAFAACWLASLPCLLLFRIRGVCRK